MKRFNPSYAKFFRVSDILNLEEENTNDFVELFINTFGKGYFADEPISAITSLDVGTFGTEKFISFNISPNKKFYWLDDTGISKASNAFSAYSLTFDDVNILSGTSSLPISVPVSLFKHQTASVYTTKAFSVIYVNGTPQLAGNISVIQSGGNYNISFAKVTLGAIYPIPKNAKNSFDIRIIDGIFWNDFKTDFCLGNAKKCKIDFGFLNTVITNRTLIMEVYENNEYVYYHIPKQIPLYDTGFFYVPSVESPSIVDIDLSSYAISDTAVVKFYFLKELAPSTLNQPENIVINQFILPYKNLSTDSTSDMVVLALDENTGRATNISNLNALLSGANIYSLNHYEGTLDVNVSYLPSVNSKLFAYNYHIYLPLQTELTNDFVNNISLYGTLGGTVYFTGTSNETFNVYIKNVSYPSLGTTYVNSSSSVISDISSYDLRPHILILSTSTPLSDQDYVNAGQILFDSTTNTATFSVNSNIQTPYNRLISIAQSIQPPPKWRTLNIDNISLASGTASSIRIPLLIAAQEDGKTTTVKAFSVNLRVYVLSAGSPTDIDFALKLVLVTGPNTDLATYVFSNPLNTSISQIYQFGINNLFNNNTLLSVTYDSVSTPNARYYLEISCSTNNFYVDLQSAQLYFEIY